MKGKRKQSRNEKRHAVYNCLVITGYIGVIVCLGLSIILMGMYPGVWYGAASCAAAVIFSLISGISMYLDASLTSNQLRGIEKW